MVLAREGDSRPGLLFEDSSWSWDEVVQESAVRAGLLASPRGEGPNHIGVLADNIPEFNFWLCAAALSGAVIVGLNPTRRGAELERDINHTACRLIVTEDAHVGLLDGLDLGAAEGNVLNVFSPGYLSVLDAHRGARASEVAARAQQLEPSSGQGFESRLYLLLFTSGTSGAPKACICTQGRLARIGGTAAQLFALTGRDVCYLAMPMFHSNALMAGWAPALAAGATMALRRRFSASGFLADVRRFNATYFNYVGKPLAYILATPERPDDGQNTLTRVFGNEGSELDTKRFAERFKCDVTDSYGSTEGGVSVTRTPDTPEGALGRGPQGTVVLDPSTGEECPPARFGAGGRLLNPEEAIGELANRLGVAGFEGYWNNAEADASRVHEGTYWSGDLAYRDEAGFVYFAGRSHDWLRVDGENFAAAPVERILLRHPDVVVAAVYAVPDPQVGDQAMAALQLRSGARLDPDGLERFLAEAPDMSPKWFPRFVRTTDNLVATETNKVLKRVLRRERWEEAGDPVWWKPGRDLRYRLMTDEDRRALRSEFERCGRAQVLDAV